jgi:SAM-dependent methyltransferase
LVFDLIYKTDTKPEIENFDYASQGSDFFSAPYHGASPWVVNLCIEELIKLGLDIHRSSFLDIGSGKGRVMIIAAIAGFERIYGVELDQSLCLVAKRNIEITAGRLNYSTPSIYNADATCYIPPEDLNVAFMFNPFGASLMRPVIRNLVLSRKEHKRTVSHGPLYIIYVNPVHAKVFDEFNLVPIRDVAKEALIYKIE